MMKVNMGFASLIMISVIIGMQLGVVDCFKSFEVGGNLTWRVPDGNDTDFFHHWASSQRFHIGDSLHFQYKNDSVLIVDRYGYYHCNKTNTTGTYTDGNTVIKLERPGYFYFISGNEEHCKKGQRLTVDVISPHSPPPGSHGQPAKAPAPSVESPTPTVESPAPTADSPAPTANPNSVSQLQVSALVGLVATSLFFV
ncbi:early nodulin-like protein 1 [Chenopodium quinoa]|uniref:early nodulin-like protein 1 n=1 Tax=Chenopodium quinoa TaxID=63459 RepID=UPI000B793500|nr:early nodulin-like protein 1 [Chenopodium quinoa]